MSNIIKENEFNEMRYVSGITRFTGCQCFKDCSCHEDFKPESYEYYVVERKGKKSTKHRTIDEANVRWDFVNSLHNMKI